MLLDNSFDTGPTATTLVQITGPVSNQLSNTHSNLHTAYLKICILMY